jgi:hypothetical protein
MEIISEEQEARPKRFGENFGVSKSETKEKFWE